MLKKKKYKSAKVKSFLFFLLLAALFWSLTKFSKEYTASLSASLHYENPPATRVLGEDNPTELSFDMTASGFQFLLYELKRPQVRINVGNYYKKNAAQVVINKTELARIISSQLEQQILVKNISLEELRISLSEVISKKVPLHPQVSITFKEGFNTTDSLRISPDSVQVTGPAPQLDSIQFINTEPLLLENIDSDIDREIGLQIPQNNKLSLSTTTARIVLNAEEFTQKELTLPISVVNVPEGISLKLIPERIVVTFIVSVSDFNTIDLKQFRLICDFAERNQEEHFMIPKLKESPANIRNIEFSEKKIDYLVFK
ncbi:YbbR-like domain-containing protein [Altibacter sp.]|uniref:CdaR family protein n=1 Tax=Altibacter sp. TaxID=2024823 RepID=UPI0025852D4D|nr:YbbR-like domain-containing protein [Altibacter sp.]MCW9037261.1 YbbR-like domain-containing protein [Altibacter sp.]